MVYAPSPPLRNKNHHKFYVFGKEAPGLNRFFSEAPKKCRRCCWCCRESEQGNQQGVTSLRTLPALSPRSRTRFESDAARQQRRHSELAVGHPAKWSRPGCHHLYYFELPLAHERQREGCDRRTCAHGLFNVSRLVSLNGKVGRCNSFVVFPYQTHNSDLLRFYINYIS